MTYKIENTISGQQLGIYEANSALEAYNLMLVDAGCDIANEIPGDIDVDEDHESTYCPIYGWTTPE